MLLRTFTTAALAGGLLASIATFAGAQTLSSAVYRPAAASTPLKKPALVAKPSSATRAALMRAAYRTPFQDNYPAPSPHPARARPTKASRDPALNRFAVGVGGGTNGGSVEVAWSINRYLVLRGQGAYLDFSADYKSSDTTYTGDPNLRTAGALLDVHPFQNPFFVSGGVITGKRRIHVDAKPSSTQTLTLNGVTYGASQLLTVSGDADLGDTAPLVGLGFDNTFTREGHWGVRLFAGAAFSSDPTVKLTATGPLAAAPTVQANLAAEQASLQKDLNDYGYYPVLSLGLFYKF